MKYYGNTTDPKDLISVEVGIEIAADQIDEALGSGGAIARYVTQYGGKIDKIKVNNEEQAITDRAVNITVPTTTNQLTNNSGFITNAVNDLVNYRTSSNQDSIDSTLLPKSAVTDNLTSTSTTDALSANQGKILNDRINNLSLIGRYLALWDCSTGLPTSEPTTVPYTYHTGDYYRVTTLGITNYRPNGDKYLGREHPSTIVETATDIAIGDIYFYDGSNWLLQYNHITGLITDVTLDGTSVVTGSTAILNKELFWCTYGVTTFTQITTALSANKLPVCYYNNTIYVYCNTSTGENPSHYFSIAYQSSNYSGVARIECNGEGWITSANIINENTSNKIISLSSSSTNSQYPSAKCVYDLVETKQNSITSSAKLDADLVDDTNSTHKFVTDEDKSNWNGKENASNKSTSITSSSTDTQYASALAVYNFVKSEITTALSTAY